MPIESALALAFVIIVASTVAALTLVSSRRRAAQEEELRQAASTRGWRFESAREHGYFVRRWHGTTDGVTWTAESLSSVRRASKSRHRRRRAARWRTAAKLGLATPILCVGVPAGKEAPRFAVAQGDGWLAQLAQKAAGAALDTAVDMYFGEELGRQVDAGALRPLPNVSIPGFMLVAGNRDQAESALAQGLKNALVNATNDRGSVLAETDRPWVLLSQSGAAIGRMQPFATTADVEAFVRAGVALTRAATFGRRSPS